MDEILNRIKEAWYTSWHMIDLGNGNIGEEQDDMIMVSSSDIAELIQAYERLEDHYQELLLERYQQGERAYQEH